MSDAHDIRDLWRTLKDDGDWFALHRQCGFRVRVDKKGETFKVQAASEPKRCAVALAVVAEMMCPDEADL